MLFDLVIGTRPDFNNWLIIRTEVAVGASLSQRAPPSRQASYDGRSRVMTDPIIFGVTQDNSPASNHEIGFSFQRVQTMSKIKMSFWRPDWQADRLVPVLNPNLGNQRWQSHLGLIGVPRQTPVQHDDFGRHFREDQQLLGFLKHIRRMSFSPRMQEARPQIRFNGLHQMQFCDTADARDQFANPRNRSPLQSMASVHGKYFFDFWCRLEFLKEKIFLRWKLSKEPNLKMSLDFQEPQCPGSPLTRNPNRNRGDRADRIRPISRQICTRTCRK